MVARELGADSCAHVPVRTCIGCRVRAPKQELLRVVAGVSENGPIVLADPDARQPGRGAYLHPTPECLALATRRRAISRALRVQGRVDEAPLREVLQHAADEVSVLTDRKWSSSS